MKKLTTNILNALNALNLWDYSLNTVEEGLASGVIQPCGGCVLFTWGQGNDK